MRNLIYLILFVINVHSASITLNEAKDDSKNFSILHIKDDKPFLCEVKMGDDFKDSVICTFSQNISPSISKSNRDFKILSYQNQIQIKPTFKISLKSLQDDFIKADVIKYDISKKHKHWIVIGYKDDVELFNKSSKSGIDFDIIFQDKPLPFVGSLDLNGLPIVQKNDAISISQIKELFEKKNYEKVIFLCEDMLNGNNSVFFTEAKLYKLRALDMLAWESGDESEIDTDEILESAQQWMSENPSSRHLPEVLMYISKTYYKLGHVNKGNEYSDILKDEFYDDRFTKIAQIHKADRIYENRKRRAEAIEIYKDVLYNTKDIMIASRAASKISEKYLDIYQPDEAYKFYKKVVDGNEPFVKQNQKKSYEFAKRFAEAKKYDLAIKIAGMLLSESDDNLQLDDMRKDISYWFELSGKSNEAISLYRQYLKDFPRGSHVGFVQDRLDKIVLDIDEKDMVKKMANIDNILEKYPNDPIYQKALIQKAQMLIEDRKYNELFKIEKELKKHGGEKFLGYGAGKKISEDLQKDNCKDAIYLKEQYNAKVEQKYEPKFFECLMRGAKYKEALELTQKYQNEKNLPKKLEWMYRALKAHSRLDENKKVIMLGEDVEKLSNILKTKKYDDIAYEKAEAYYNLQDYDDMMLKEVMKVEKLFPKEIKNIDLFVKVLRYAKNKKNDTLSANYAQKIIALQKLHKISSYSPRVELDYINALKRLKQYDKALAEDLKLLYVKLNDTQRANVLYIAGELSLKIDKTKEAKEFFMKCGEIVEDSSWQRLCAENLKLLDDL